MRFSKFETFVLFCFIIVMVIGKSMGKVGTFFLYLLGLLLAIPVGIWNLLTWEGRAKKRREQWERLQGR